MIRKLLPMILGATGLMIGAGAGFALRPATNGPVQADGGTAAEAAVPTKPVEEPEYVKLSNQFIVPVIDKGHITSMVILSLSLEVTKGSNEKVYSVEPKLRDGFLQVMFDHANSGGFSGVYTDGANLISLRSTLLEVAKKVMGNAVSDVLILDIVRQDS